MQLLLIESHSSPPLISMLEKCPTMAVAGFYAPTLRKAINACLPGVNFFSAFRSSPSRWSANSSGSHASSASGAVADKTLPGSVLFHRRRSVCVPSNSVHKPCHRTIRGFQTTLAQRFPKLVQLDWRPPSVALRSGCPLRRHIRRLMQHRRAPLG